MADISKIKLNGTTYNIKDEVARAASAAGLTIEVVETLPLASAETMGRIYLVAHTHSGEGADKDIYDEFVTVNSDDSYKWERIGNTDTDLSQYSKKTHIHDVTSNVAVADISYTPEGTISGGTFTGTPVDVTVTGTPAGAVTITAYTPEGTITGGEFTGAEMQSTGNVIPKGSVAAPEITVETDSDVYSMATEGSYTASKWTAGSYTASKYTPEKFTYTADTELLTLENSTYTPEVVTMPSYTPEAVTLPTRSEKIIFTGSATAPAFTGASTAVTVTGTTTGSVSAATFSGEEATLTATFKGDSLKSTGSVTATGSVSELTFEGTEATLHPEVTNNSVTTGAATE